MKGQVLNKNDPLFFHFHKFDPNAGIRRHHLAKAAFLIIMILLFLFTASVLSPIV